MECSVIIHTRLREVRSSGKGQVYLQVVLSTSEREKGKKGTPGGRRRSIGGEETEGDDPGTLHLRVGVEEFFRREEDPEEHDHTSVLEPDPAQDPT